MLKTIFGALFKALLLVAALTVASVPALAQDTVQDTANGTSPDNLSDVEDWIRANLGDGQAETPPGLDRLMDGQHNATALQAVSGPALVDFGTGKARAAGVADLPADSVNPGRDKALAQRTAAVEARKHLLQVLLDLPLDGSRTVAQALAGEAAVQAELRGLAQNSRLTTEMDEPMPGQDGQCVVKAELDMAGPVAERLVPVGEPFQTGLPFKLDMDPALAPPTAVTPADEAYRQSLAELGGFTGVVVDARGLGLRPALLPRIMDRNGLGAYGPFQASRAVAVDQGIVVYVTERSDPRLAQRAGGDPLWVRGLAAVGDPACDVVVSVDDGALIRKVFEKQELRAAGALVVLVD